MDPIEVTAKTDDRIFPRASPIEPIASNRDFARFTPLSRSSRGPFHAFERDRQPFEGLGHLAAGRFQRLLGGFERPTELEEGWNGDPDEDRDECDEDPNGGCWHGGPPA